jgi:hypothetical protein
VSPNKIAIKVADVARESQRILKNSGWLRMTDPPSGTSLFAGGANSAFIRVDLKECGSSFPRHHGHLLPKGEYFDSHLSAALEEVASINNWGAA